jgi:hypothetical protein
MYATWGAMLLSPRNCRSLLWPARRRTSSTAPLPSRSCSTTCTLRASRTAARAPLATFFTRDAAAATSHLHRSASGYDMAHPLHECVFAVVVPLKCRAVTLRRIYYRRGPAPHAAELAMQAQRSLLSSNKPPNPMLAAHCSILNLMTFTLLQSSYENLLFIMCWDAGNSSTCCKPGRVQSLLCRSQMQTRCANLHARTLKSTIMRSDSGGAGWVTPAWR